MIKRTFFCEVRQTPEFHHHAVLKQLCSLLASLKHMKQHTSRHTSLHTAKSITCQLSRLTTWRQCKIALTSVLPHLLVQLRGGAWKRFWWAKAVSLLHTMLGLAGCGLCRRFVTSNMPMPQRWKSTSAHMITTTKRYAPSDMLTPQSPIAGLQQGKSSWIRVCCFALASEMANVWQA